MRLDIKFTLRRILKNRFSAFINVMGLTIGIFVTIALINFYIQESTYDHHHEKVDRTFKAISRVDFNKGAPNVFPITFGTLAESILLNFNEVEQVARMYGPTNVELDLETQRFNDIRLFQMDYSFFQIFDFPDFSPSVFNSPNNAIISYEAAQKLFNGDAIGKQITVENITYTISAITFIPKNTVFKFDIALPLQGIHDFEAMVNGGMEFETYVTLKEGVDPVRVRSALSDHYNQLMKAKWPNYEPSNFFLPLKETYLNDVGVRNRLGNGDSNQLTILFTIALVVLILALINYINLQIASNHSRLLELRVRKIMGADKAVLMKQSVIESSILLISSTVIAIGLLEIFYSSDLRNLFGKDVFAIRDWALDQWGILAVVVIILGLIAGTIPSLKLFNQSRLTQQMIGSKKLSKLTIGLVIFQFFVTASLLTTILFVNKQMDFIRKQSQGYSTEQVVVVDNLSDHQKESYELIRSQLLRHPQIMNVAAAQSAPGRGGSGQFVYRKDKSPDDGIEIAHIRTLEGYANTLELNFLAGTDFTIKKPGSEHQFILNELAAQELFNDDEQVIGSIINMSGREGRIVGVVENFHFLSLKYNVSPLALNVEEPYKAILLIKVQTDNVADGLNQIERVLKAVDPPYVFDYQFLDDQFDYVYQSEIRMKKIATYATGIAFSISIMGLLALSLFVINSKVKEIAIRKTLGGSHSHIFLKLSSQLMTWIIIGNLTAIPVTYYIANTWIQEFIYRISINNLLWMCALSTFITLCVGLLIILRKLYRTMTMNPVEFLKYE